MTNRSTFPSFRANQAGPALLRIISAAGRVVHEEHTLLAPGDQSWQVSNTDAWSAGVYMYELLQGQVYHAGRIVKR